MLAFVARQPILDRRRKLFAYELLFRSGPRNIFDALDGAQATGRVINDSMLVMGGRAFTRGRRAFINFPEQLLLQGYPRMLPKDWVGVEVLETVEPSDEVVKALGELKRLGYYLILDDFVYQPRFHPFLRLADLVKVDILAWDDFDQVREMVAILKSHRVALLAEKVETHSQFRQAMDLGFAYFQGYFFSRPEVVVGREVAPQKLAQLQLLRQINQPELSLTELEAVIKQDLSLAYKLLRYINSAGFGLLSEVKSIRQALALLGRDNIRLWASLLALASLSDDKPDELVVSSVLRARFCEMIAPTLGLATQASDLFLLGLFSHLDAIMDQPLEEALRGLPLNDEVRGALLGQHGRLRLVLETVDAYERGDWLGMSLAGAQLGMNEDRLSDLYAAAVEWAQQTLAPGAA
ncbi:MAG: HDOD domain-containing protein [Desulfarculus sp.]|nr:HDOD domain-containing protein [Desulfarculus sp.]